MGLGRVEERYRIDGSEHCGKPCIAPLFAEARRLRFFARRTGGLGAYSPPSMRNKFFVCSKSADQRVSQLSEQLFRNCAVFLFGHISSI